MSGITFEIKTSVETASLVKRFKDKLITYLYNSMGMRCYCTFSWGDPHYHIYGNRLYLKVFTWETTDEDHLYSEKLTVSYDSWEPLTTGIDEEVEKIAFLLLFEGGAS